MAKGQKQRKQKVSKGSSIGSKPVRLSVVQLALLGKGLTHTTNKKAKKK